jgi:hypothetical protein
MDSDTSLSVSAWLIFIGALVFRHFLGKSRRLQRIPFYFVIPASLTFIAGAAMAEIVIGEWLAGFIRGAGAMIGGVFEPDIAGSAVVSFAVVVLILIAVVGLSDLKADKPELMALLLMATFFVAAAGAGLSGEGSQLTQAALNIGSEGLSALVS